jgi:hypothetical protein
MMTILPESQGNLLGVQATNQVTGQDYEKILIPRLEAIIQDHGQARFLCYMDSGFRGMQPRAMWDDAVFAVHHRNDFTKVAVVGGKTWIQWAVRLSRRFMRGDMKTFSASQLHEAWQWVTS